MQDAQDRSIAFLESSVREFKVFIDTCSLLSEQADRFWVNMVPILQRENQSIIIPYRVYEEVKKFADDPNLCIRKGDPELNRRAKAALSNIGKMQRAKLVAVFGDKNDNFADNVFQTVFTQFRLKYNLMLITQDKNLASDIISISKSKAVNSSHRILVERINRYGFLSIFHFGDPHSDSPMSIPVAKKVVEIPDEERFAFATSVRHVSGEMTPSSVPGEGDQVTAQREENRVVVKLEKSIASGGEGAIFTTDIPNVVAKIYKPEKIDRAKYEKLKLMLTKSIDCEGVCFPLAIVYNQQNEFVGYLMKKAQGKELQKSVFIPQLLKKNFPNWKKNDTVTLCITILSKLQYLHDRNIILGDINPNNILVVSPKEVYFVDTDSYQIEGFPCPVGTINFTAPEIQRKKFDTFLRTIGNERFAVATLLFMIMLPGKPPYSMQGGENQIDNIINGDFAYASGTRSTGKAPDGMWRFCWSHLPRYLKDDFYETFRKDGEHSTEKTRYSTGDWLKKFEYYLELLNSGKLAAQDSMSVELFPTRLKKNKNTTYIRCKICGNEVDEERTEQGICQDCLKRGEIYHCARCGCEMVYTNYQKYIKRTQRYEICKDCLNKKNMVYTTIRCSECGNYFPITYGEKEFFEKKGFPLPKKCKHCRSRKTYSQFSGYSTRPTTVTAKPSSRKKGFCFITTAVCEYLGKTDDCYELTTLRQFRDEWLSKQPGGKELIQEYYQIAPSIVTELNHSTQRDVIYTELWNRYIQPCIKLIELKSYAACRDLYEMMIHDLKQKLRKES